MNFKFHKKKLIVCLIVMILTILIGAYVVEKYFCYATTPLCIAGEACPPFKNPCNMWNPVILITGLIFPGIPVFIIAYIIYSLIEKK